MSAPAAAGGLPPVGTLLGGRWRLERRLAAGGMGAVYRASGAQGERVAVKVLRPELSADADLRRRFRRESSILAALDHPGVVRIYETGEDERAGPFTVMELLEGETLESLMARGPLPPSALGALVRDVAEALSAVHDHGVVHGDLKPANVFLVDGVRPKLVDFGLAKVYGLERLTQTGEVLGTPSYMAPELLTGEDEVDGRVDVYALGVILYEAIGGFRPFRERNPGKLLVDIVRGNAPPLVRSTPSVSPSVSAVVDRAMASRPETRFRSVRSLANAFVEAIAEG